MLRNGGNMTLVEAVEKAKNGEPEGYEYLYEQTYSEKYSIALHYMKNKEDAQDVLHDSYLRAWAHIAEIKKPDRFSAWLSQIVVNTAKNMLKKQSRTISIESITYESEEGFEYGFDKECEDKTWQPEAAFVKEEDHAELLQILSTLSEEQRICVQMYYIDGLKAREIAEKLNCPLATVKSRLTYARNHLRKQFE